MHWECACGFVNSLSSLECEACGWTRSHSERFKSGLLPKITDEEQRKYDKSTLNIEIIFFIKAIGLSVLVILVTIGLYDLDVVDGAILIIVFLLFSIAIIMCLSLLARLWWRSRKI